jgi:hypothetical protein
VQGENHCILAGEDFREEWRRGVVACFDGEGRGSGECSTGRVAGNGGDVEVFSFNEGFYNNGAEVTRRAHDDDVLDFRWSYHFKTVECSKVGQSGCAAKNGLIDKRTKM